MLTDFERPLNERGKNDAPIMAQRLLDRKVVIDIFIASPSKRTKKTAELFCNIYQRKEEDIQFVSALYHASAETIFDVVENIDDRFSSPAIFCHNPGVTEFVNRLVEDMSIDNMPTCSVFAVKIDIDKWCNFRKTKKEFLFFDYPKIG